MFNGDSYSLNKRLTTATSTRFDRENAAWCFQKQIVLKTRHSFQWRQQLFILTNNSSIYYWVYTWECCLVFPFLNRTLWVLNIYNSHLWIWDDGQGYDGILRVRHKNSFQLAIRKWEILAITSPYDNTCRNVFIISHELKKKIKLIK